MPRAFVIRPFGTKKDSKGTELDFDRVHEKLIGPALVEAGLDGGTTGELVHAGNIRSDMFSLILAADLIICDITVHNANVFYELGIRHALRKGRTLLIRSASADTTPFDLSTDRYLEYDLADPGATFTKLVQAIRATLADERHTDSPVFLMLPSLPEANGKSSELVVPLSFQRSVDQANAAKSAGWLRLLAEEVMSRPFGQEGRKNVARAQEDLKDWEGAEASWDSIRVLYPEDIEANFALANIYERRYENEPKNRVLISSSYAAIDLLLKGQLTAAERSEAIALKARNQLTEWAMSFELETDVAKRRRIALSRSLLNSYQNYREAFLADLNHYRSGVCALQTCTLLLELAGEETWPDIFDSDKQAEEMKAALDADLAALNPCVRLSLIAAEKRIDPKDVSFGITKADVLFLTPSARPERVVGSYDAALPEGTPPSFWDSTKSQLELFAGLGYRRDVATKVIERLEARAGSRASKPADDPLQVIIFAGHRIDRPNRESPRFPAKSEARARELIRAQLEKSKKADYRYEAYASGCPGADIIFHELCEELNIKSTICLPMPADHYAKETFGELFEWQNRFLKLTKTHPIWVLSDRPGLDTWLEGSNIDPWERGNRWVLQLAVSRGTKDVGLIAFWDGKPSDGPGGTGHMVQITRDTGSVEIHVVDAAQLFMTPAA